MSRTPLSPPLAGTNWSRPYEAGEKAGCRRAFCPLLGCGFAMAASRRSNARRHRAACSSIEDQDRAAASVASCSGIAKEPPSWVANGGDQYELATARQFQPSGAQIIAKSRPDDDCLHEDYRAGETRSRPKEPGIERAPAVSTNSHASPVKGWAVEEEVITGFCISGLGRGCAAACISPDGRFGRLPAISLDPQA